MQKLNDLKADSAFIKSEYIDTTNLPAEVVVKTLEDELDFFSSKPSGFLTRLDSIVNFSKFLHTRDKMVQHLDFLIGLCDSTANHIDTKLEFIDKSKYYQYVNVNSDMKE